MKIDSGIFACLLLLCLLLPCNAQDELATATAAAIKFANRSVVQIDTIGGLKPKGKSLSTAPFSGTVVSEDGLILTASYNLLHQPASIFVRLKKSGEESPERLVAEIVASDESRNLTLLRIEREGLVPIEFAKQSELLVGQRAIAIGKSVSPDDPHISLGIVSAKGRIWNRATQTDAKISRLNYGGPLLTLDGKAIGILVPLSHSSTEVGAGDQWYDSGIGFASVVDPESDTFKRLLDGESLRSGRIGITFEGPDENADPATISFCLPSSPAGKGGLKVGDTIVNAGGTEIVRQGQFKHVIGPLYEKEMLDVKVDRDGESLSFSIELAGKIDPYLEPEIGVLLRPSEDQPVIEFVFSDSPAAKADLKIGDVVTKVNETNVTTATELREALSLLVVGDPCELIVDRDGESIDIEITPRRQLADFPGKTPSRGEAEQQQPFESIEISVAEGSNKCFAFIPKDDGERKEANATKPPLLVWVPPPGAFEPKAMFARFEDLCTSTGTLVLVPMSIDPKNWLPDEASVIAKAAERLEQRVAFDRNRIVIAGKDSGGKMAMLTAFSNRGLFKGVAVIDTELSTSMPNVRSLPSTRLHMLVLGEADNDESVEFFREKGFSIFRGPAPKNAAGKIAGWLSLLDRL